MRIMGGRSREATDHPLWLSLGLRRAGSLWAADTQRRRSSRILGKGWRYGYEYININTVYIITVGLLTDEVGQEQCQSP